MSAVLFTWMLLQFTLSPAHSMDSDCENWLAGQAQEPPYALKYFKSVLDFAKWQDQQNALILRRQAGLAANEDSLALDTDGLAGHATADMSPILEAGELDPLQWPGYARIMPLIFSQSQIKRPAEGLTGDEVAPGMAYYPSYQRNFEIPLLRLGVEYPMSFRLLPFETEMQIAEVGDRVPVAVMRLTYGAPASHPIWVANDLVGIQMRLEAAKLGLAPLIFGLVETPKASFLATEIVAGSEVSGQNIGADFASLEAFFGRIEKLGWKSLTESVPLQLGPVNPDMKFRVRGLKIGMIRTFSESESGRRYLLTLREETLSGGLIPMARADELSNVGILDFPVEIQTHLNAINGRLTIQRAYLLSSMTVKQAVAYLEYLRTNQFDVWQALVKLLYRHSRMLGAKVVQATEKLTPFLLRVKRDL